MSNGQAPNGFPRLGGALQSRVYANVNGQAITNETLNGALKIALPLQWSAYHTPAAATQATVTRSRANPAGTAGLVVTAITGTLIIPPAANQPAITLDLSGDLSGIVWSTRFGVGASVAAGAVQTFALSGLMIPFSTDDDVTLAFSAAGVGGTLQSVSMTGYDY